MTASSGKWIRSLVNTPESRYKAHLFLKRPENYSSLLWGCRTHKSECVDIFARFETAIIIHFKTISHLLSLQCRSICPPTKQTRSQRGPWIINHWHWWARGRALFRIPPANTLAETRRWKMGNYLWITFCPHALFRLFFARTSHFWTCCWSMVQNNNKYTAFYVWNAMAGAQFFSSSDFLSCLDLELKLHFWQRANNDNVLNACLDKVNFFAFSKCQWSQKTNENKIQFKTTNHQQLSHINILIQK